MPRQANASETSQNNNKKNCKPEMFRGYKCWWGTPCFRSLAIFSEWLLSSLFSVQYACTAGELFQDDLVPCVYCGDDFLSIFQRKILFNQRIQWMIFSNEALSKRKKEGKKYFKEWSFFSIPNSRERYFAIKVTAWSSWCYMKLGFNLMLGNFSAWIGQLLS